MQSAHNFDKYIINDTILLDRLYKYASAVDSELLVYDLETNSANEKIAEIYGFGLCWTDQKAFYVPIRNRDGTRVWTADKEQEILSWLKNELNTKKVIGHNIIFDVLVTENQFKFTFVDNIYSDTILMKHTIDEERPHGLKDTAVKYLGPWADLAQDRLKDNVIANGGKWTEEQKDMYLADTTILGEYCCFDVVLTLLLFNKFTPMIKDQNLEKLFYVDEIMPLYKECTIDMKRKGFRIDLEHFNKLNKELEQETISREENIIKDIKYLTEAFEQKLLDEKIPVKPTGNFPKVFAEINGIPLPLDKKTGKTTLSKKALEDQKAATTGITKFQVFYDWLIEKSVQPTNGWIYAGRKEVQESIYLNLAVNEGKTQVFNLGSGDHLGWLIYEALNIEAFEFTEGGKPSTKADVMDTLIERYKEQEPWMPKLLDLRKLKKIKSTYVEGILDRQTEGFIYTSMLQFGTTSGRYSSTNPNLQNLPSVKGEDSELSDIVKHYVNEIRKGFIAPDGYKIIAADYSQLEPSCFAAVSGDIKLQEIFIKGWDIYSKIAIDSENLYGVSADKKSPDFLKDKFPEIRKKYKEITLAIPYGAEEGQISKLLGIDWADASELINRYLNAYPNLRKYMNRCNYDAKKKGFVTTDFGRIRHLPDARRLYSVYGDNLLDNKYVKRNGLKAEKRKFKNLLNNAKNFPIQGLAAHIVNNAMLDIARQFKAQKLDAWICLSIHDEIVCICNDSIIEQASNVIKTSMENTTKIAVPLYAKPIVASNLGDAK